VTIGSFNKLWLGPWNLMNSKSVSVHLRVVVPKLFVACLNLSSQSLMHSKISSTDEAIDSWGRDLQMTVPTLRISAAAAVLSTCLGIVRLPLLLGGPQPALPRLIAYIHLKLVLIWREERPSVTITSVPPAPIKSFPRSKPASNFRVLQRVLTILLSGRTTV
jgi:hypothetical protein